MPALTRAALDHNKQKRIACNEKTMKKLLYLYEGIAKQHE
jgi:hypothetical protein